MGIFYPCKYRWEAVQAKGFDWYKIVKVEGGYRFFETALQYNIWKAQR